MANDGASPTRPERSDSIPLLPAKRVNFESVGTSKTTAVEPIRSSGKRKSKQRVSKHSSGRNLSPEDYTKSIYAHSRRSITSSIYPGNCYIDLAAWLQRPSQSSYNDDHCLAVLYDLASEEPERVHYLRSSDLQELNAYRRSEQDAGQVLLLRGCPSAEWTSLIGGKYQVDPEFFHRHLEFFVTLVPRGILTHPSLPSTSTNIQKLCITTILYQERPPRSGPKPDLQARRIEESESMATYRRQFQMGAKCGDSIVRGFETLDEEYSLLEQEILICTVRNGNGWLAIVWLDTGRDLFLSPAGPWINSQGISGRSREPLAIIQHHPKMTVRQTVVERAVEATTKHPAVDYESRTVIPQSTGLLPFELETFIDEMSARENAMYALSNIFRHAAFSESQVLNVLDLQVEHELGILQPEKIRSHTLDNLQYFSSILTRHIRYIRDALRTLKLEENEFSTGGDPTITSDMSKSLVTDFDELLQRALDLHERCKDGMGVMQNRAIIVESRKAIEQSERVKKLTMLASFFVPLSFSTSVFGMNFKQFGQGELSVWLFAVISIPIVVLSFCFYLWDVWAWICGVFWSTWRFITGISEWRYRRQKRSLAKIASLGFSNIE